MLSNTYYAMIHNKKQLINLPADWGKDWSIAYGLIWRDVKAGMVSDFIKALEEGMLLKDNH